MKNYYANNPEQKEKKNEYDRRYREEHREYFKEKAKEYREKRKLEEENEQLVLRKICSCAFLFYKLNNRRK